MINVNDIKVGMTVLFEGDIYSVIEFLHVKPGKGAAFMKTKLRNLRTGSIIEKTFNSSIKLEKAMIEKHPMQFLYNDGNKYNFMNMQTFEQIELSSEQVGEDAIYLKEGLEVDLTFYEGELLGLILPDKIAMKIVSTEPAVKGNTTNNAQKDAVLETGHTIRVPLFIEEGETVLISTKDGNMFQEPNGSFCH